MRTSFERLGRVIKETLPRGRSLSEDVWRTRHRTLLWLLRAHVVGVFAFALIRDFSVLEAAGYAAIIAVFAALAGTQATHRRFASAMTSLGLVSSSAVLVYLSGGLIEMHFHFFVMVGILTLYQDWMPFLLAVAFVLLHHAVLGYFYPAAVYDHPQAIHDPIGWAIIHAFFLLAACVASVVAWKMNEDGALRDPLTRLPNRALFADRVDHALARTERLPGRVAVLFVDLDGFKAVNDDFGHAAGDQLLRAVAERLRACIRRSDTAARFGGDEFAVLIEDSPQAQVMSVAQRILEALAVAIPVGTSHATVTGSVGVAYNADDDDVDSMLRKADLAMYSAKSMGRNRLEVFAPEMHLAATDKHLLQHELRGAAERGEIVVHYQPVISLESSRCFGVEALARWAHPTRGLLAPASFISLAEATGAIMDIGSFVIQEACRQCREWQLELGRDDLRVSVNVSAAQLGSGQLVHVVEAALRDSGLPAPTLILELTEAVLIGDAESTERELHDLKRLGIQLAVDDFGTGYSSLSYLRQLPVDIVKIDKAFIDRISDDPTDLALVGGIVKLAETLHLATVAEGVESAAQVGALHDVGCDLIQGFVYAKPEPADKVLALIDFEHDPRWAHLV